jgi:hypothetical protein
MAGNPSLAGRERILLDIIQGVLANPPASFSLVGSRFVGKSPLLGFLADDEGPLLGDDYAHLRPPAWQDGGAILPVRLDCSVPAAQEVFISFLAEHLVSAARRHGGIERRLDALADLAPGPQMLAVLRLLAEREERVVFLLDHFDRVFADLPADTLNEMRPLTYHAAFVVATEQPLQDLDRTVASSPFFNVMTPLLMKLLSPEAARLWLQAYARERPSLQPILGDLAKLTATHPFLLRRLGDSLVEVAGMIPAGEEVGAEHLPLIRLRLAEQGRLLFENLWRRLQNPPEQIQRPVLTSLLHQLVAGSVSLDEVRPEERATLNWLINQSMVTCCAGGKGLGYDLFSPLFTEYLAERLPQMQPGGAARGGRANPSGARAATGATRDREGLASEQKSVAAQIDPAFLDGLTRIEAALYEYFVANAGRIIPPDELLAEVWRRPDATARRVQEAIRRLRAALERTDPPVGVIENDRGRGYRFMPHRE